MPLPAWVTQPSRPTDNRRTWPLGHVGDYDPQLIRCARCDRKTDGTIFGTLRIWRVRRVSTNGGQWMRADVECADTAGCRAHIQAQHDKRVAQAKRRRPDLPHADGPRGSCKWCGQEIRFDERRKGWKRRRTRGYHRGDEWERKGQPTDCVIRAIAWRSPKAAMQELLKRQKGRCVICGYQLASLVALTLWYGPDGKALDEPIEAEAWRIQAPPYALDGQARGADVDHREPIWRGGTNALENLQAICHEPCHKAKTRREARERAKERAASASCEPEAEPIQPALALG